MCKIALRKIVLSGTKENYNPIYISFSLYEKNNEIEARIMAQKCDTRRYSFSLYLVVTVRIYI